MFKLYACKLRIGGSVLNEIRKDEVTAPEIEVLRVLHGSDAILDIKEIGESKRSDRAERARLEDMFASPSSAMGDSLLKKKRMLTDLFGHERLPLPKEIEVAADLEAEADEEEDVIEAEAAAPAEPPKRTKAKAQTAAEADFAV